MAFVGTKLHARLGKRFFDSVRPADFGNLKLRFWHKRAAASVGLDVLSDHDIEQHFGRFTPLAGSFEQPLALRYHGHQFRVYNPDIGDGRGFLFAQCWEQNPPHRLLDFGTKGTGQTPYSRSGDGFLTLKGAVRELLATSMLAAQGVPTSRTFAIFEHLGAKLYRGDEPSPARGAVLTRLSHSHIRFGTFQRLAYEGHLTEIDRLVRYCLTHYVKIDETALSTAQAAITFFADVVRRQAITVAAWMMAGFVHGVLNTDNMNVSGESFDYGPWRWVPTYNGTFTAAYFDHQGLYAYGRQSQAVFWNLQILASVLTTIQPNSQAFIDILQTYSDQVQYATIAQFFWRMALKPTGDTTTDTNLVEACLGQLKAEQSPFEDVFYASSSGQRDLLSKKMQELLQGWPSNPQSYQKQTMLIEEVEHLWSAIAKRDDWNPLNEKIQQLERLCDLRQAEKAPAAVTMESHHD